MTLIDIKTSKKHLFAFAYRLRPGVNRMFIWSNKVRNMYFIILIACIYFFFRLPLVNKYSNELIGSSLSNNTELSIIYNLFEQASISKYLTFE